MSIFPINLDSAEKVATVVAAFAVTATSIVALVTLLRWKEERRFDIRLKHAFRIMSATNKIRRSLFFVRGKPIVQNEIIEAKNKLYDTNLTAYDYNSICSQILLIRLNKISEDKDEIDKCSAIAKSIFGDTASSAIDVISSIYDDLYYRASMGIYFVGYDVLFDDQIRESLFIDRNRKMGFDKIESEIAKQVNIVENECSEEIRHRFSTLRIITFFLKRVISNIRNRISTDW